MTKNSGEPSDNMPDQFDDFEIAPEEQIDDFFTDSQPTSQLAAIIPDDSEETTTLIAPSAAADVTEAFWGGGVSPDTPVAVSSNLTDDLPDIVEEIPAYDYLGHVEYEPEFEEEDDSTHVVGGYFGNQQLLEDINIPQKSRFTSVAGSRRFWNAVAAAAAAAAVVAVAASAAWVLGFRESGPTESAEEAVAGSSVVQNDTAAPQELASPTTSKELEEETPVEEQKAEEVLNVFPRMEQSVTAMKKEKEKPTTTTEIPGTVAASTGKTTTTQRTSSFVTTTAPPVTSPSVVAPPQTATTLPTTAAPATTIAPVTTARPVTTPQTTAAPTTPATTATPPPPVTTVKPTTTPKPVTTVEATTTVEETTTTTDECEKDDDDDGATTTTDGNSRAIFGPVFSISLPFSEPEPCDPDNTSTTVDIQVTTTDDIAIAPTSNQ